MLRRSFLLLAAVISFLPVFSQPDSSHLRISLITCGPGDEEIWEVFGHTAIRVVDSLQHTDLVYNYGTFDYGPDFEIQFMRGKLLYSLSVSEFSGFMPEYVIARRSVEEQVINATGEQKEALYDFLNHNAEPANRYYKYDFFFDNCATRIRDVFPRVFGSGFRFGQAIRSNEKLSFRDITNRYFYRDHWTRLGVNILLGSRIDKVMTNEDIMFLPDYLRDGIGGATVNGSKITDPPKLLLSGSTMTPAGVDWPFLLTCFAALLTVAGLAIGRLRIVGIIMSKLLLFCTGLLGVIILVMWFATDHQACSDNFNLLWCLPTNLVLVFAKPKGRARYSVIAIMLILVSLLLHIIGVQGLPLPELGPVLLSLLLVFGATYRQSKLKPVETHA